MGNCFSYCLSGDDDDYRLSPSPAGSDTTSGSMPTAVTTDTSLRMGSVICRPAGSSSLSISTSADVIPEVLGPCSPSTSSGIPDNPLSSTQGSSGYHNHDNDTSGFDTTTSSSDTKISLSSFTLHQVLGQGAFGKVILATHRKSQQKVAIKSVLKTYDAYDIELERYALEMVAGCPFVTQLYATFQTRFSACFVMPYVCGGNLLHFITDYAPVDNDSIKFIVGEVSCGLEYIHGCGILHRDLKLENILMDGQGHIRIADFGLSVVNMYDTKIATGRAGTRGYMAPEVINNDFYQFEPDWFSLGVVTYILATDRMPFRGRTMDEYRREVNFTDPIYPPEMDPDLEDFIKGLLCRYPDERLGIGEDIRCHPFMDGINWEDLEDGKTSPPFPVDTPMDTEVSWRLSPSAINKKSSSFSPEEEIYIPRFTYINSAWARV